VTTSRGRVADRYELLEPIATGGMGRVWRAHDVLLGRPVAVKILRSELSENATFRARFRAEAQHAGLLAHPNIAAVFDYGEEDTDDDRVAYLVMELVNGEPLSAVLEREGSLPPQRVLGIVRQTAAALAAAHAARVVHRDIKPGNVLLARDGTVKITDFGIAVSATSVPLTATGQVIGTAHYLSPEQASGGKATPASDVYALGAVAYECLTGRRVFDGENSVQIALKQIRETPPPLPASVPADLRALVERAMAKDPAQRFPDGAALLTAVENMTATRPTAAGPTGTAVMTLPIGVRSADSAPAPPPARPAARPGRRRVPWALLAGSAAALLLVVLVVVLASSRTPTGQNAPATSSSAPPSRAATVAVTASTLVGRPVADVQAELASRGLTVALTPVTTASVPAGQVTAVSPEGALPPGSTVTLSYAVAPAVTQAPQPQPQPKPQPPANQNTGKPGKGHGDG
jgi:serine/threonine-protein kinase